MRLKVLFLPIFIIAYAPFVLHSIDLLSHPQIIRGITKITSSYSSFSWDNTKNLWYEVRDIKTVSEEYDGQGRLMTRQLNSGKSAIIEKSSYSYDTEGFVKITYNNKNEIIRTASARTNIDGIVETIFGTDKSVFKKYVSILDSGGRIRFTEIFGARENPVWLIFFETDERGDNKTASYYNPDGSLAFEYAFDYDKYDNRGNWTTCVVSCVYGDVGSRGKEVIYRDIGYKK
jgi:hypothetical protein